MDKVEIRPIMPGDKAALDALVSDSVAADPSYGPPDGTPGSVWLGQGVGACLTRFVAENETGIIGHIAVGSMPPCPQKDMWTTSLKKNLTLVEIRRGMVHPSHIGDGVGGKLTKVAFKWATERNYLPVAASVTGRINSVEMMRKYGWSEIGDIDTDGYGTVTLWVPPAKIVAKHQ